jgi:two-component system response regulator RegA
MAGGNAERSIPSAAPRSALLVDDDPFLCRALARAFRSAGWEVRVAGDCAEALAAVAAHAPDLAVVDLCLPDRSGLELLDELRALAPSTRAVMVSGYCSVDAAVDAIRLGAIHYLTKPARYADIVAALARAEHQPVDAAAATPTLAAAERAHIERVLAAHDGNVSQTARALGIPRRSLQRKLQRSD